MTPVPWRYVETWNCLACGRCCRGFEVSLRFGEWANLVKAYGVGVTEPRLDRLCLRKRQDGTCVFLYRFFDWWLCRLQHMKPKACKLWPFKIHGRPKYGRSKEAAFNHWGKRFFVYVDPLCRGIKLGAPTQDFTQKTLPEFLEIGVGLREKQHHSTSKIPYHPMYLRLREKQKFRRPPPIV